MKYDKYFVLNCGKYFSASYITILTRIQAVSKSYLKLKMKTQVWYNRLYRKCAKV